MMTINKVKMLAICVLGAGLVGSTYAASVCPAASTITLNKTTGTLSAPGGWVSNSGQVNVRMPLQFLGANITQSPHIVPHNAPQNAVNCEYGSAIQPNRYAHVW